MTEGMRAEQLAEERLRAPIDPVQRGATTELVVIAPPGLAARLR